MKPWLFDILACPIDKHFPLKLYIFSYETTENEFNEFLDVYENRNLETIKKEELIDFSKHDDNLFIKDGISIKKMPFSEYLNLIKASIKELGNLIDKTEIELVIKCHEILTTQVMEKLSNLSEESLSLNEIEEVLPELYLLNKFKLDTEIDSGLLFCEECLRWFPIIESIPQMLPDEYRNEENDLQFLKKHKNLFDPEFFKQNLHPYNL
ncbi:MAG: Trm112 family protein [Promethearchaeota archaeon]